MRLRIWLIATASLAMLSALVVPASVGAGTAAPGVVLFPSAPTGFVAPDPRLLRRMSSAVRRGKPWNIVIILTDDQPDGTLTDMRTVRRELAGKGITYNSAVIPTPICCPSRASLLTGLYAQGTGVYDNTGAGAPGGYRAFRRNGNERRTFALALHRRGYRTGMFGKYLNEYGAAYRGNAPPGWDLWRAFAVPGRSGRYWDFRVTRPYDARDRRRISKGRRPLRKPHMSVLGQYSTTYFGKLTARFIRDAPPRRPVLAMYAPYAPHAGFEASGEYRGTLTDDGSWMDDPSVMEEDVSDKPFWVGSRPLRSRLYGEPLGGALVKQRETLLSVDDEVDRIVTALRDTGRLGRTVIVFASDNGYMHGQHRLTHKSVPYRGATDVPLVVRFGNQLHRRVVDPRLAVANVDVSATIRAIAGVRDQADGVSLLGPAGRKGVPLVGTEYGTGFGRRPPYCGWRTADELFVRYGSGEEEYYDYTSDPFELRNRVDDPAAAGRVASLRAAAAMACRPAPPGFGDSFAGPSWRYSDPPIPDDGESDEDNGQ